MGKIIVRPEIVQAEIAALAEERDFYRAMAEDLSGACKWIPVNERHPKYADFVWVKLESNGVALAVHNNSPLTEAFRWMAARSAGDAEGMDVRYYLDVTHWQPLEKPSSAASPGVRKPPLAGR